MPEHRVIGLSTISTIETDVIALLDDMRRMNLIDVTT